MDKKQELYRIIRIVWIIMELGLGIFGVTVFVMNHSFVALAASIWLVGGIRDIYGMIKERQR